MHLNMQINARASVGVLYTKFFCFLVYRTQSHPIAVPFPIRLLGISSQTTIQEMSLNGTTFQVAYERLTFKKLSESFAIMFTVRMDHLDNGIQIMIVSLQFN